MLRELVAYAALRYVEDFPLARGKQRLMHVLAPWIDGTALRSFYGPSLRAAVVDSTFRHAMAGKHGRVSEFMELLRPGDGFVDVGANHGVFSALASGLVGSDGVVVSFEPSRNGFSSLVANLELNACLNAHPFPLAVSNSAGLASFVEPTASHSGGAHLAIHGSVTVPVTRLDQVWLVSWVLDTRRTMLKLDTEGGEIECLEGLGNLIEHPNLFAVVSEVDRSNLARNGRRVEELYGLMETAGFEPCVGEQAGYYDELFIRP